MRGFHRFLLVSVSVFALSCAGPSAAQDAGKVLVGGSLGVVLAPNDVARTVVDTYDFDEVSYDDPRGTYVSGVLGYRFGNGFDIIGRLSSTRSDDTLTEFQYDDYSYGGEVRTGFDYQTLDLEAGFTPVLDDNFDVRFAVGLRALSYSDRLAIRDKIEEDDFDEDIYEKSFFGVGPRVALDLSARLPDSAFGLTASAAGSVVFGELDTEGVQGGVDKTVTTLEAKLTGDYYVGDIGKLSLGYRAELLSGMHDFEEESIRQNQLTHGPVLEFLGSF